ncbi:DivIVA domain-containing protein [Streptomyces sp. NPDC057854]|uniref:DivIVA domain-containing protein n=1 Tax=unclassified Streptomyces TaxID=2593676 RepID=UPI0036769FF8
MLTPADIGKKQFGTTRLREGYDQDEVDDFLDLVEADYRSALARVTDLEASVVRLRSDLAVAQRASADAVTSVIPVPPAAGAERILAAAQRTADQVEAEANTEAGKIRAAARADADSIKHTAEAERQAILNRLETERAELAEKIEMLKARRANYRAWLRAALSNIDEEEAKDA